LICAFSLNVMKRYLSRLLALVLAVVIGLMGCSSSSATVVYGIAKTLWL